LFSGRTISKKLSFATSHPADQASNIALAAQHSAVLWLRRSVSGSSSADRRSERKSSVEKKVQALVGAVVLYFAIRYLQNAFKDELKLLMS
jgi:hypothetical protein